MPLKPEKKLNKNTLASSRIRKLIKNMQEVIYSKPEHSKSNTEEKCPSCTGSMRYGDIPCPDGIEGCLVIHYGFECLKCGKIYK